MEVFSAREQKIIKIIGRKTKMTIAKISAELFKEGKEPFDSNILVSNSVRRIIDKCSYHDLAFTLLKTRENNKLTIKRATI